MELRMRVASICFSALLYLNFISCERHSNRVDEVKWVCNCASNPLPVLNSSSAYNCSTACHCLPDEIGVPDGISWSCSCTSLVSPQSAKSIHRSNCFSSCNCAFGSTEISAEQKRISNKGIIVILLACLVVISIALFASIAFHFYRKEQLSIQRRIYSSVRDTSSNSSTNFLSSRSASFLWSQHKTDLLSSPFTNILHRISAMFRGEKQILPGSTIQFSFSELEQATDRFSNDNLIGQGISSNVFRGKLMDGRIVAVKKLKMLNKAEADTIFLTEIELISRLNHCHVVPLIGYCSEYQSRNCERLLVFEYMSNGNLRECLDAKHGKEPLSWATRVRVAMGVARGLEYLHEASAPRILHRDIKSTNILLDNNYRPKITDLGMAKYLMSDDHPSCPSSPARMLGTFGYFAPEYAIIGKASQKSDVFSYGVVILELITGRQPIQKSAKGDESLVIWSTARLNDSKLIIAEMPDPLLKGNFPEEEMQIMAHLARECLQWDPDSRPTMTEIVQILATIAPEKYQRRNFHENFQRGLSWRSIGSNTSPDKPLQSQTLDAGEEFRGAPRITQDQVSVAELKRENFERIQDHFSSSSTSDHSFVENERKDQEMVLSAEYMQQLLLLASSIQNNQCYEEDVDLTEPRFESFV